jgi:hypothetical protein
MPKLRFYEKAQNQSNLTTGMSRILLKMAKRSLLFVNLCGLGLLSKGAVV